MPSTSTRGRQKVRAFVDQEHTGLEGLASLPTARDPSFGLRATEVAGQVDRWGFLAHPDLPDGPGPAFLVVALRPAPTLRHYDPESVEFWVTYGGRGQRRTLTNTSRMPQSETFSWGPIRLVDRLGVSNEFMTFGGLMDAALIDDAVVAAFASPAPLLRQGGHSQGWDPGADAIGGFFGRMMVAVDFKPGFEAMFGDAAPVTRYAAFVRDTDQRRSARRSAPAADDLGRLIRHEATRLRATAPGQWDAAGALLDAATVD